MMLKTCLTPTKILNKENDAEDVIAARNLMIGI